MWKPFKKDGSSYSFILVAHLLQHDYCLLGINKSKAMSSLGIENDTGGVLFFSVLEGDVSLLQILNHHQQPSSHTLTWLHKLRDGFCSICSTEKKDLENILLPTLTTEFFSLNAEHYVSKSKCAFMLMSVSPGLTSELILISLLLI